MFIYEEQAFGPKETLSNTYVKPKVKNSSMFTL